MVLDEFFQYKGTGVGGKSQKYDLRAPLADFQILEIQGNGELFGYYFWYCSTLLSSEILGIDE